MKNEYEKECKNKIEVILHFFDIIKVNFSQK